MPGNRFVYLQTHAIHDVVTPDGNLTVVAEHPGGVPNAYLNGIQIVVVPEPATFVSLAGGAFLVWLSRRRRR
ncbi:MAG: PEP-CTERM sorting domain-containing protein [Armatimonadetes bacterium]|nr:PEP-CTERM sorting domain-containing protein [Armatimonadota bacterium]